MHVRADALRHNYARIRQAVGPDVRVLPMVKANAYGLGVEEVVRCLEPLGPWGFGVATVQEGVTLRESGVERPIVVCSPTPATSINAAIEAGLQLSVSSIAVLERIERAARAASSVASVHLDVDTGMGRSGFDWRTAESWLPVVTASREYVRWVGCYTHLHSADEDEASVEVQWRRLSGVLDRLDGVGEDLLVHVLNSAGVFRAPSHAEALVRPGIFLFGGRVGEGQPAPEDVVSIHARVVHTRDVQAGTTLGYGSTHAARGPRRWATLSIGYGDGLPRALGNRGSALLRGVRVPIIGRISMDVKVVDITEVPEVMDGDIATLLGSEGEEAITIDDMALMAGTISYEILTGLTSRLSRMWSGLDE